MIYSLQYLRSSNCELAETVMCKNGGPGLASLAGEELRRERGREDKEGKSSSPGRCQRVAAESQLAVRLVLPDAASTQGPGKRREGRGMLVGMGESPQQSVSALSGRVLHGATLTWKIPSHRDLES